MAEIPAQDQDMITRFKLQSREFWNLWQSLNNQNVFVSGQAPTIQREYNDLIGRGSRIRAGVETATGLLDKAGVVYDNVKGWFVDTFGLDAINNNQLNAVGLLPLIPIAVIGGSLAAMGKWISDVYIFNQRLNEIKRLEQTGVTPQEAANVVSKTMPTGFFGNIGKLTVPLLLIGLVLLAPQFKRRKR